MTQGINTVIMRVQGHKTSMAAIANMNSVNRRRTVCNRLPDANTRELLTCSLRQRNGAGGILLVV